MEFCREYSELCAMGCAPEAYMNPRCRFTTPWDMLINQMLQQKRGLHNSCGFGIWETVLRYKRGYGMPIGQFVNLTREDRRRYLMGLRDGYFAKRFRELGLNETAGKGARACPDTDWIRAYWDDEALLCRFEEDCETMRFLCPMRDEDYLRLYKTVLFENAQGLLLDGNSLEEQDFTTPSTTGSGKVFQTVERVFQGADVEIAYISRSYLTRHGDGSLTNELDEVQKSALLPYVKTDETNHENRFQGILRYGMMDVNSLADRIGADFARCHGAVRNRYRASVMITHMNEFAGIDTGLLADRFDTLYLSDGKTHRDVYKETVGTCK
jgi:adenylosuccinate synthase